MKYYKNRYKFNKDKLIYEKVPRTIKKLILQILLIIILTVSLFFGLSLFYNTPKEIILKNQINTLITNIYVLNMRIDGLELILSEVESVDSIVYRSLFDVKPFYRKYGKITKDSININSLKMKELLEMTHEKINRLEVKISNEYYDLKDIEKASLNRRDFLMSIPSIQPISNKDLKRTASGWGWRIHPIYHIKKFHYGIDFSAKKGTSIYSTGNAKVYYAGNGKGYGNIVILDHGYGYKTLYGHMNKIYVKKGEKINRGTIIGEVGSTGMSTGPHLHYEVIYHGQKVNPIHYFFNDLSPSEYDEMIKISSQMNKTFD